MRVLIVIPARGGSTRVPRKNLAKVGGKSLVMRAVKCAFGVECGPDWHVKPWRSYFMVSTEDVETALEVVGGGDDDPWWGRVHPRRCGADGPMVDVLLDCLAAHPSNWTSWPKFDAVLCLQPTSPLRTSGDVIAAIDAFVYDGAARSLVSVNEQTGQRNGAIYITRVEMLRDGLVFDDDSLKYPMPAERSLDINTQEDLEEARRILGQ